MTFEIEVNGRSRAVTIERLPAGPSGESAAGHRFRVTIDGTVHVVDAVRVDQGALSLVRDGASHHVAISDAAAAGTTAGEIALQFAEGLVRATVNGRRARRTADASGPAGAQRIVAPMPGKVLRVLVQPNDQVAARQPLVVVEAMKMENELSSPKAGRVKDVAVAEGQSVEAGRLLVIVE